MDIDKLVDTYVRLRDKARDMEDAHKAAVAPIKEGMARLEGLLMARLSDAGADSVKTPHGTAYKTTWTKASVRDFGELVAYVKEHDRFDLFPRSVNKTIVLEIGEVPGVEIDRGVTVNVRRS